MRLNHNLIHTTDLNEMVRFWAKAIGLRIGERPPFSSEGVWFYSEGKPLIHIEVKKSVIHHQNVINHLALEGDDYETLIKNLKKEKFSYIQNNLPLSQEKQVFINGPDGLCTEILFPA